MTKPKKTRRADPPKPQKLQPTAVIKPAAQTPAPKAVSPTTTAETLTHIIDEIGAAVNQFTIGYTGTDYKAKLELVTGDMTVGRGDSVALAISRASQKAKVFYGTFAKRGQ